MVDHYIQEVKEVTDLSPEWKYRSTNVLMQPNDNYEYCAAYAFEIILSLISAIKVFFSPFLSLVASTNFHIIFSCTYPGLLDHSIINMVYGMNENQNVYMDGRRTASRVTNEPGGKSSVQLGWPSPKSTCQIIISLYQVLSYSLCCVRQHSQRTSQNILRRKRRT